MTGRKSESDETKRSVSAQTACCGPVVQQSCCEPEAKSDCCGTEPAQPTCGCGAQAATPARQG